MAGFGGSTGVPKKYVDDLVAQSTAFAHSYSYNNKGTTVNMTVTGPRLCIYRMVNRSVYDPLCQRQCRYIGSRHIAERRSGIV